jgi:hypothetical protein
MINAAGTSANAIPINLCFVVLKFVSGEERNLDKAKAVKMLHISAG